ncbi:MAG: HlyD family efflux transporter periplasmic adaptor subunit [Prolixibacteraceae bacterium]|jgi:multidrug efflux pump subunit AcrA (membrane-fusion protein)|nr:HlyD family efflux transporter periplasmic adaptor subunit [Prolixibacteraceae bacterium]
MTEKIQFLKYHMVFNGISMGLFSLLFFSLSISCGSGTSGDYTIMKGSFRQSVIEAGELEAIHAANIMMPRIAYQYGYQFKIIGLAEHGKIVHKGDSIVKLDPSSIYKYILEGEDKLENELAAANKQTVQSEENIQALKAQMKNEQASYDLEKLELDRSKFDTDAKRRIKELKFQQATVRLKKAKRKLELTYILEKHDQLVQKIRVIQRKSDLRSAKENLKQFLIKSPCDGIFQVSMNIFTNNPQNWRLGDTPYQGQMIASIPDINRMKVKTYINEAEFNKVKPGMKVIVRLDALPAVPFNGFIKEISKICFAREKEKVFKVVVEISESDLRLKPGMTVSCEYILYESDKELFVPNNCLFKDKGHAYIFLKRAGSSRMVEVKSGPSNTNHTIISGDIKPGQKVLPFEYELTLLND